MTTPQTLAQTPPQTPAQTPTQTAPLIAPLPEAARALAKPKGNRQAWMITFTDLVALMLTFFVMLFAMMTIEVANWRNLTESLATQLNSVPPPSAANPDEQLDMPDVQVTPGANLDYLAALLERRLEEMPALEGGIVTRRIDHLVLSLPSDLLFASGTATPQEEARSALFELGGILRHIDNVVEVAGHADPRAIRNGPWPSNWELSLSRAAAVATLLRSAGVRGEVVVLGHGETRFDEVPADLDPDARLAMARRVDILIHERAGEF
jgi:chemotaxis protein MotB